MSQSIEFYQMCLQKVKILKMLKLFLMCISNSFVNQSEKEQQSIRFMYCVCKYLSNVMKLFLNLHM